MSENSTPLSEECMVKLVCFFHKRTEFLLGGLLLNYLKQRFRKAQNISWKDQTKDCRLNGEYRYLREIGGPCWNRKGKCKGAGEGSSRQMVRGARGERKAEARMRAVGNNALRPDGRGGSVWVQISASQQHRPFGSDLVRTPEHNRPVRKSEWKPALTNPPPAPQKTPKTTTTTKLRS